MASALVSVATGTFVGSTLMYPWEEGRKRLSTFIGTTDMELHGTPSLLQVFK